jgi:streptomycin 6-kinase
VPDGSPIDTAEVRTRLTPRFGQEIAGWCDKLPAHTAALAGRWRLRLGQEWPTGRTSVVLPCWTDDGTELVLKLTPELKIATDEATALRAWTGLPHAVQLHEADLECGALLLERIQPGTQLADEADPWSLKDAAPVMTDLWQPAGAGHELPPLRDRVEFVFDLTWRRLRQHPAVAARVPSGLMHSSLTAARALAGDGPVRLLHGDLHPGNLLRGEPGRGLVAIDPRPCLGDPASDTVDWVMIGGGADEPAMRQRIDWLTGHVTGLDPDRIWAWCRVLAVLSAVSLLARQEDDPLGQALLTMATRLCA